MIDGKLLVSCSVVVGLVLGGAEPAAAFVVVAPTNHQRISHQQLFSSSYSSSYSDVGPGTSWVGPGSETSMARGDLPQRRGVSEAPMTLYDDPNNQGRGGRQQQRYRSNAYNSFEQSASSSPSVAAGRRRDSFRRQQQPSEFEPEESPLMTVQGGSNFPHYATSPETTVQGGSRSTWSSGRYADRADWTLRTDGRPLDATFEVWEGPDNTPQSVRLYSEDGYARPWRLAVENPSRGSFTHSVRNTGPMAFPLAASSTATSSGGPSGNRLVTHAGTSHLPRVKIQGGSLKTFPFTDHNVRSVEVSLQSDGLPVMATVELWQGPTCVKQLAEVYADNGATRPFRAVVDTYGGTTIAIRNTGPVEYPISATLEPLY